MRDGVTLAGLSEATTKADRVDVVPVNATEVVLA